MCCLLNTVAAVTDQWCKYKYIQGAFCEGFEFIFKVLLTYVLSDIVAEPFVVREPCEKSGAGSCSRYAPLRISVDSLSPLFGRHWTTLLLLPHNKLEDAQNNLGLSYKEIKDVSALCSGARWEQFQGMLLSKSCREQFSPLHATVSRHCTGPKPQG